MGKKTVREVKVTDVEKRKYPGKHYIYILEVSWSEGTTTVIYRRYSDFFEFQCELLERFPEEAGAKDPATRMIPFLPGKKLFSRSQTRTVAEKRKDKLNDYCQALIRLPSKISDDNFIIDFFEVRPDDLNPVTSKDSKKTPAEPIQEISDPLVLERFVAMADYEKQKKNECSLQAGQQVEVIDKNANGWWFVNVDDFNEGWVPATFLEPLYGASDDVSPQILEPGEEEVHVALSGYTPQNDDEIAFEKGVLLEVFEKGLDGWWKVRYQGKEGFAPAAYLQRYLGAVKDEAATGAQVVSSIKDAVLSSSSQNAFPASSTSSKPVEPVSPKPARVTSPSSVVDSQPKFAPTWHSVKQPYIDKEPIYAPTPRRHSIVRKPIKARLPQLAPKPTTTNTSSPTSPTSPTEPTTVYDLPGPVYESIDNQPKEQIYITIGDFTSPNTGDGLSFGAGVLVSVITKNSTGWWYVDMDGVEGWVPSSYLESSTSPPISPASPTSKSPPPLPVRNSIAATSKKDWLSSSTPASSKVEPVKQVPVTKEKIKFESVKLTPVVKEKAKPAPPAKEKTFGRNEPIKLKPVIKEKKNEPPPSTKVQTVSPSRSTGSLFSNNKSSLRRSQSTESLERETPPRPAVKRINSPPTLHVTSSTGWRPKPAVNKPAMASKSPVTLTKSADVKKASSKTLSPRTGRLTKSIISDPVLQKSPSTGRKSSVSKTVSLQGTTKVSSKHATLHSSGTKSSQSLFAPESDAPRTASFGSRPAKSTPSSVGKRSTDTASRAHTRRISEENTKKPAAPRRVSEAPVGARSNRRGSTGDSSSKRQTVKRGGSEESIDSEPNHLSELESKLRLRVTDNKPKKASPPQRPKAPSINSAPPSRPKGPPKRPEPPKATGTRRVPPPRPSASPQVKRNVSYVSVGDYVGEGDSCLSFKEGEWVDVVEKNTDGWWFVEIDGSQGWAPSSFLEEKKRKASVDSKLSRPSRPKPPPPQRPEARNGPSIPSRPRPPPPTRNTTDTSDSKSPGTIERQSSDSNNVDGSTPKPKPRTRVRKASTNFVRAVSSYDVPAYEDSGVTLRQGRLYEVKERSDSGWWLIKDGDIEGWAPGSHFEAV